jgi:hypothetical protein
VYRRRIDAILPEQDRDAMELHIADNPEIHPVVQGTAASERPDGPCQEGENEAGFA